MTSSPEHVLSKQNSCCCGCCALSTGTVVASLICAIECAIGIFWNVQLWMHLDEKESLGIFERLVKVSTVDDFNVIHGLVIASTILHIVWLALCAMVLRANFALNKGILLFWMLFVDLQSAFDVGTTIYFGYKLQSTSSGFHFSMLYDAHHEPTVQLTYLTLMILFSRGVVFWFLNLYLAHVVQLRGKEIEYNNSLLALYIISQFSPPRQQSGDRGGRYGTEYSPSPPAYDCHPNYLPKYLVPRCREGSLESSWELNNEVLQGISAFSNPLYPRIDQTSVSEFRPRVNPLSQPPPYGLVALENEHSHEVAVDTERSYRHEGQGVLPY